MPPALALAAILTLAAMLAGVSALAGVLWWRLRTLSADETVKSEVAETLVPALAPVAVVPVPSGPRSGRRADRSVEAGVGAGPTLIAVPDLSVTEGGGDLGSEMGRRFGGIWELADGGASAEAIARATGQPIGQVELILNLRRQMAGSGGRS